MTSISEKISRESPSVASRRRGRIRRIAARVGVACVSTAVALLLIECAARIVIDRNGMNYGIEMWKYAKQLKRVSANDEMAHEHKPGARAFLMGHTVQINSHGLRDDEFQVEKPPQTYRILVLGDSITFGWGVAASDTYCNVLEELLNNSERTGTAMRFEVINSGVGNYNTKQEVAFFKERGLAFDPDMVLLGFYLNDAELTPRWGSKGFLAKHSYLHVLAGHGWDSVARRLNFRESFEDYYAGLFEEGRPGWQDCRQAVKEWAVLCREYRIQPVLLQIPDLHLLGAEYPFGAVHAKVAEVAKRESVPTIDPLPAFDANDPQAFWVSPGDAHPNGKGQRIIAETVYEHLRPLIESRLRQGRGRTEHSR